MWSSDAAFFLSAVVTNLKCIAAVTPDGLGMSNVQTHSAELSRIVCTNQANWLAIMGTAKVSLAYLRGQSSPTGQDTWSR